MVRHSVDHKYTSPSTVHGEVRIVSCEGSQAEIHTAIIHYKKEMAGVNGIE